MLSLETPIWAQNPQCLQQIVVFNAMPRGIFVLTVQNMNAPTVDNAPLATPNIVAIATTVLFAAASATPPITVQTATAPFAMTQATSLLTALS